MNIKLLDSLIPWIETHFGKIEPRGGYAGEIIPARPDILPSRRKYLSGYASPKHRTKV